MSRLAPTQRRPAASHPQSRSRSSLPYLSLLVLSAAAAPAARAAGFVVSDHLVLAVTTASNTAILASDSGNSVGGAFLTPVQIQLCAPCVATSTDPAATAFSYTSVVSAGAGIVAEADIQTAGGSALRITDSYDPGPVADTITMRRVVTVTRAGTEQGFNTEVTAGFIRPSPVGSTPVFSPGNWYGLNTGAASNTFDHFFPGSHETFWHETRSGLPLVAAGDSTTGYALTLAHTGAAPSSNQNERSQNWITSAGVQYGSLGVQTAPRTAIGFIYPAEETDGVYLKSARNWVGRSSPVQVGQTQSYTLTLALNRYTDAQGAADFPAATTAIWRQFYAIFDPALAPTDTAQVYDDAIDLLASQFLAPYNEPGLPFNTTLSTGKAFNVSYEMGYTGEQIPDGYQMLRAGFGAGGTSNPVFLKGERILDFWANHATQPSGLPLAWYVPALPPAPAADSYFKGVPCVNGARTGCDLNAACQPLFIRDLSDGMEGTVEAAVFARAHGFAHPAWEQFAEGFGNWLQANQNQDGSFDRAYNVDGSPFTFNPNCSGGYGDGLSKVDTTHPIRFLVELYEATGEARFLQTAENAGTYAMANIYGRSAYIGGTSSINSATGEPVIDKEAGLEALHAALALYDATGSAAWLAAARQAADYAETFLYAYNYPIQLATPAVQYAGTRAYSLTAPGGNAADISSAREYYDFYRLHLFGDDSTNHYLRVAEQLEDNGTLTTQLDSGPQADFGFGAVGLLGEATDVADLTYPQPCLDLGADPSKLPSSCAWLPWLTEAELEPVTRMEDTFGVATVADAQKQSPDLLQQENNHPYPARVGHGWSQTPD